MDRNAAQFLQLLTLPLGRPLHQSVFEDHLEMAEISFFELIVVSLLASDSVHELLSDGFGDAVVLH